MVERTVPKTYVLIEDESQRDCELLDHKALRSKSVRENLDGVGHDERREGNAKPSLVQSLRCTKETYS